MTDYLQLAADLKQQPAAPVDYSGAAAALKADNEAQQRQAVAIQEWKQANDTTDPERQAQVLRYAAASGLAPAFVGEHLDDVKRQVDSKKTDWARVAQAHPEVFNLVGDPERGALAKDDVANLETVDWSLNPLKLIGNSWIFRAPLAALRDATMTQTATIPRQVLQGAGLGSEENAQVIENLDRTYGQKDYGERSWLAKAWLGLPKMLPMIAGDTASRALGSSIATAAFGVGGAGAASETGPGAVPAGLVAGAAGKYAGQFIGSWAFNTATSFGPLSWELGKLKDADGNPIDPNLASGLAMAAASVNGLIGAGLFGKVGEAIPGVREALQRANAIAVRNALSSVTTGAALKRLASEYGEHVALGAAMMGLQSATNAAAIEAGKAAVGDPDSNIWRMGEAGTQGFVQALQDMTLLAGLAPGRQFLGDLGRIKASVANGERLAEIVSVAQASKLLERSPQDFERYVERLRPDAAVYIPAEAFAEHFRGRGIDPAQAAREMVGDGGRAFAEAAATNGDVRIPMSRFALFARTEHAKALLDDAKLRPEDLTPKQAAAEAERVSGMMRDQKIALDPKVAAEMLKDAPPERAPDATIEAAVNALTPEERAAHDSSTGSARLLLEMRGMLRVFADPNQPARTVDLDMARAAAAHLAENATIAELQPGRHLLAERNNAARAFDEAARGRMDRAYAAREAQILSREMHRATVEAKGEMDAAKEFMGKTGRDAWRAQLGLADEGNGLYLEAHDSLLHAVGLGEGPTGSRALEAFDRLVSTMEEGANPPAFDSTEIRQLLAQPRPWNRMTVNEARNLRDAVRQIRFEANNANKVRIGAEKQAVRDVVGRIAAEMEKLPDQGKAPASRTQESRVRDALLKVQSFDANALDPETLFGFMGEESRRFFWDRYLEARKTKDELSAKVLKVVEEQWSKLPKSMQDRRYEVVPDLDQLLPIPEEVNLSGPRDRSWVWMVALNMGNKSNRERLLGGFGWAADQVLAVLNRPEEQGGLSREEWRWVESVWKANDEILWPLIRAKEEAKNGIGPKKIEATPIATRFGEVSGGYFPAKYDPRAAAGDVGARQSEAAIASLYGPSYRRASTQKSHTKQRAEHYENVLDLNWSVVPGHIAQVVHDLAFDIFVRDTARVVEDPVFKQAMFRRLGEERAKQPREWLKVVANEQADTVPGHLAKMMGLLGGLRNRAVMGAIGGSISVAMGDLSNPLVVMASGDVSARNGAPALAKTLAFWPSTRAKALELSPELRHRAENNAGELRKALAGIGAEGNKGAISSAMDTARVMAFAFQEMTEKLAATTIFMGALRDAQAKGMGDAEAVRHADAIVRGNLPSHNPAEQSALLRDKRGLGSLLMFHGYFNKLYNVTRRQAHAPFLAWANAEGAGDYAKAAGQTALAAGRILAVFAVANGMGEYFSGRGKEDDETWGQWLARKVISGPFSIIPFGSTIGEPLSAKLVTGEVKSVSIRAAPALSTVQSALTAIGKIASDEREPSQKVWDAIEATLLAANLPVRQVRKTGEYLTRLATGDTKPENLADLASGLIYGERDNQPANPMSDLSAKVEGK